MRKVADLGRAVPLTPRARLGRCCVIRVITTRGTAVFISMYLRIRNNCFSTCESLHALRYFVNPPSLEVRSRILGRIGLGNNGLVPISIIFFTPSLRTFVLCQSLTYFQIRAAYRRREEVAEFSSGATTSNARTITAAAFSSLR